MIQRLRSTRLELEIERLFVGLFRGVLATETDLEADRLVGSKADPVVVFLRSRRNVDREEGPALTRQYPAQFVDCLIGEPRVGIRIEEDMHVIEGCDKTNLA